MEKPISVKREDFIKAIVKAVNECGLPPFAAFEVLRDITREAEALARRQYEADKAAYEESLKEAEDGGHDHCGNNHGSGDIGGSADRKLAERCDPE